MVVVSMTRMRDGVLRSADSATISILDSSSLVVVPTTAVLPTSTGVYSFTVSTLLPGSYSATWTFTDVGYDPEIVTRPFTLNAPVAVLAGVSLTDIERSVARRIGPYRRIKTTAQSSVSRVVSSTIKSSVDNGSYEDLYMLRRGLTWGDQLIGSGLVSADDRVRLVSSYDASNGYLNNDREWAVAPNYLVLEAIELHYLDPDEELRPAVLDGLKRCFFWDDVVLTIDSAAVAYTGLNLTAVLPWLTNPRSIRDAKQSLLGGRYLPSRLNDWVVTSRSGNVWVQSPSLYRGSLTLSVLRPVNTFVNEEDSIIGPNDDLDQLNVPLDYAAWAGVLECWKNFPDRLQPAATQELRTSRKDAAAEFTRWSLQVWGTVPEFVGGMDFGTSDLVAMQIGNLAETP